MLEDPRVIRVLAYQRSSLLAAGGTFGSSLQAFRGDPDRPLAAWVPPCSRSVQRTWHGSRLGFPCRRPPGGPAALGNVARSLQVLPSREPREGWIRGTALSRLKLKLWALEGGAKAPLLLPAHLTLLRRHG